MCHTAVIPPMGLQKCGLDTNVRVVGRMDYWAVGQHFPHVSGKGHRGHKKSTP